MPANQLGAVMAKIHFNVKTLDSLKPPTATAQVDYWDESFPYFGVRISQSGRKSWTVMYRHQGRLKRMTLGQHGPTGLTLADARQMAKDIHHQAAKGIDPAANKKADRHAELYSDLVDRYLEWAQKNKSSWPEDKRILHRDVLPHWKNQKAKDITRKEVIHLIDGVVKRGAPVHANRTLALIKRVFNFAIEKDIVQYNPCQAIRRPTKEVPKERVLSFEELRQLWSALEIENKLMAAIMKIQLLTSQRPGEVLAMEWKEVDLNSKIWTIPGIKSKNGLAHRVPLSAATILILKNVNDLRVGSNWVFPSPRSTGSHVGSVQKLVERVRKAMNTEFTAHDLRRTAASHMTGMGIPRLVVSKILNHTEAGVTRIYDRHGYDIEKRNALEAWAAHLHEILNGKDANVLRFSMHKDMPAEHLLMDQASDEA
jgi:integrase